MTEVLDKFTGQEFTCEYKYDGERAQIHVTEDGKVSVSVGTRCELPTGLGSVHAGLCTAALLVWYCLWNIESGSGAPAPSVNCHP